MKRSRLSTCVSRATWLERVADDLKNHASAITICHSSYRDGGVPKGNQIVEALLKDAEAAVNVRIPAEKRAETMKLLRLDRGLLERFAVDGRNITANRAAKDRYGL